MLHLPAVSFILCLFSVPWEGWVKRMPQKTRNKFFVASIFLAGLDNISHGVKSVLGEICDVLYMPYVENKPDSMICRVFPLPTVRLVYT